MPTFTEEELESIVYVANERAAALRGYTDTNRISGEAHWRGIAEKAENMHTALIREKYYPGSAPGPVDVLREFVRLHELYDADNEGDPWGVHHNDLQDAIIDAEKILAKVDTGVG